jgi:CheY-like chemotaxis protein
MKQHAPISILIADHDRWTRHVVASTLAEAGFAIHEATNGMAAVRAAARVQPHVVLLGAALPEIGAADVLRAVRSDPQTRHTAVVEIGAPGSAIELLSIVVEALGARHDELQRSAAREVSATDYVLARARSRLPVAAVRR